MQDVGFGASRDGCLQRLNVRVVVKCLHGDAYVGVLGHVGINQTLHGRIETRALMHPQA